MQKFKRITSFFPRIPHNLHQYSTQLGSIMMQNAVGQQAGLYLASFVTRPAGTGRDRTNILVLLFFTEDYLVFLLEQGLRSFIISAYEL